MDFSADLERKPSYAILQEGIGGDQLTTEFRLGMLHREKKRVIMSVSLLDVAKDVWDIRFGYRLQDVENEWNVTPMDFAVTSKGVFVPREDRALVRRLICESIVVLIKYQEPLILTMSTYYRRLPPKALAKYTEIETRLVHEGWRAESYRSDDEVDRWLFTRPHHEASTVAT